MEFSFTFSLLSWWCISWTYQSVNAIIPQFEMHATNNSIGKAKCKGWAESSSATIKKLVKWDENEISFWKIEELSSRNASRLSR